MTYNAFLLGKVVPSLKGIYIASNGLEIHLPNYEVFVTQGPGQWIRTSKSSIPPSAILAGKRLVAKIFLLEEFYTMAHLRLEESIHRVNVVSSVTMDGNITLKIMKS